MLPPPNEVEVFAAIENNDEGFAGFAVGYPPNILVFPPRF